MHKKKRKKLFLITSFLSFAGLTAIVLFLPPTHIFTISMLTIPIIYCSFFLLFLFLYSLTAFLFKSFIHGILVGLFPVVYLFLRMNELTNPVFFVLLLGLFVAMEILLVQVTRKHALA